MLVQVVPGCDMAGVVVGKGDAITKFEIGDEVYGNIQDFNAGGKLKQLGTLAEFIVVEESLIAAKPNTISFEEAASLPLAVQTAIEGFTTAGFKEGQTVFVVGGAGGVGTLVVQLAKHFYGASLVVSTTSTPKVEFVRNLGADEVVDYTKTRYEDLDKKYDLVYDTIGKFLTQAISFRICPSLNSSTHWNLKLEPTSCEIQALLCNGICKKKLLATVS